MLRIDFDETYNAQRAAELQREIRRRQLREELEEKVRYWRAMTLAMAGILFIILCFVVRYGVA